MNNLIRGLLRRTRKRHNISSIWIGDIRVVVDPALYDGEWYMISPGEIRRIAVERDWIHDD